jgi:hypothetical protein
VWQQMQQHQFNTSNPYLFRVVTQKYGKGIVQYGADNTLAFPGSKAGGGTFYDVCDSSWSYIFRS